MATPQAKQIFMRGATAPSPFSYIEDINYISRLDRTCAHCGQTIPAGTSHCVWLSWKQNPDKGMIREHLCDGNGACQN